MATSPRSVQFIPAGFGRFTVTVNGDSVGLVYGTDTVSGRTLWHFIPDDHLPEREDGPESAGTFAGIQANVIPYFS